MIATSTPPGAASERTPLEADRLIDEPNQHRRPRPYPILPFFTLGIAPVENPYRQDHIRFDAGAIGSVLDAQRPVKLGGGAAGQGDAWEAHAQAMMRAGPFALNGAAVRKSIDDYTDGAGLPVRFGYERFSGQTGLAWFAGPGRTLRMNVVHDRIDDLKMPLANPVVESGIPLIAGAGADPIHTIRTGARAIYEDTSGTLGLDRARVEAGYGRLDREADNFSLRPFQDQSRVRSELGSNVWDTVAFGDLGIGPVTHRLGTDLKFETRDGTRFGGPNVGTLAQLTGYQFPGAEALKWGAFWEGAAAPWSGAKVTGSLRGDYWSADAARADDPFRIGAFAGTPRALYGLYYGPNLDVAPDRLEGSGKLKLTQQLAERTELVASAGRLVRFPDLLELFFALPSVPLTNVPIGTSSRQIGNPALAPEIHHRADVGIVVKGEGWRDWRLVAPANQDVVTWDSWRLALTGFVDQVDDFISRDRARRQPGILQADAAAIWRNVDATLAGAEADLQWNLTRNLSTRANLFWVYGENRTDARPLYGISPFEANLIVDWHDRLASLGTWNIGAKLRLVADQNRADVDPARGSGYDPAFTPGFALFDLYASLQINDRFGVAVGVDNVFDRRFAEHVAFLTTDDTNPVLVRGPGRFAWARIVANF